MRVIRCVAVAALTLATLPAAAAEVVWLQPPTDADAARVAALAGASRGPLSAAAFRATLTDRTPEDAEAIAAVAEAIDDVRVHEAVLDGELLILEGLQGPLDEVDLIDDVEAREPVVRALLYQGFAVDRFWGDTLGADPRAAPWRLTIDDTVVEKPWLDAFALDPLRRASEADIGEAPQREAFDDLRRVLARVTRARVLAPDLPEGARLIVDGEEEQVDDTTVLEVLPGHHWMHVELDGHVLARHDLRLEPGQRFQVDLAVPEPAWQDLLRSLRTGEGQVPSALRPTLEALGGEVWIAEGAGEGVRAWRVRPRTAEAVSLPDLAPAATGPGPLGDVALAAWVGPAWLYSPDFRDQLAAPPDGAGLVHGLGPLVGLALTWDRDWLRYGLGVDAVLPVGEHRVALSGDGGFRVRPTPHLILGHPLVQATVGLLVPYHLVGGVQATVPLPVDVPLEVRGHLRAGATPPLTRRDGSTWSGAPVVTAGVALGTRLRPR